MRRLLAATLFLGTICMAPSPAAAACSCECVNGQEVALCDSALDIPPSCGTRVCPISPPAVRPVDPITLPPLGTEICTNEQVYNPATGRYEWAEVCY